MRTLHTAFSRIPTQRWMRLGSILISWAAVILLGTAFGAHFYSGPVFSVLLTLVLIALCVAIVLHVQFQDLSARKSAEEDIARNLDKAESAGAEADAFRKTTLALTQNLRMDYVLDTLLQSLLKLVPCESARILLVEAGTRLFLAREVQGGSKSVNSEVTGNF